jgi:hypothetical protein
MEPPTDSAMRLGAVPAGIYPATLALLVARGCPDDLLQDAYDWLARQLPGATVAHALTQIDQAITVARSMHAEDDDA